MRSLILHEPCDVGGLISVLQMKNPKHREWIRQLFPKSASFTDRGHTRVRADSRAPGRQVNRGWDGPGRGRLRLGSRLQSRSGRLPAQAAQADVLTGRPLEHEPQALKTSVRMVFTRVPWPRQVPWLAD